MANGMTTAVCWTTECSEFRNLQTMCDILETVNLPDSVTDIGWSAFEDCPELTSITFPAALTRLGPYAFRKCGKLNTVNYEGTIAQWAKVSTNFMWHDEVPATVVKCSDGDADFH